MEAVELIQLIELACELHEPGEANPEYTRGQVNLICDASGIPLAMDLIGGVLEQYITYQVSMPKWRLTAWITYQLRRATA